MNRRKFIKNTTLIASLTMLSTVALTKLLSTNKVTYSIDTLLKKMSGGRPIMWYCLIKNKDNNSFRITSDIVRNHKDLIRISNQEGFTKFEFSVHENLDDDENKFMTKELAKFGNSVEYVESPNYLTSIGTPYI